MTVLTQSIIDQLLNQTIPSFQATCPITLNLGFGHLFYGFSRLLRPTRTVVVGSKAGYAPILFALGALHNEGIEINDVFCERTSLRHASMLGKVHFVDPSYSIERGDRNHWYGLGTWDDPQQVFEKWKSFGVEDIVQHFKVCSEVYIKNLDASTIINLLYIDGDHSYEGIMADLVNFHPFLDEKSVVLAHDVDPNCKESGGYRVLQDLPPELYEFVRIPVFPGLAILRKRTF